MNLQNCRHAELPLLLNSENCPLPVLDSVDIHIEDLIAHIMD